MGNVGTNVYAKFRCAALHIKKVLGIFRERITTRRTIVAFGTRLPRVQNRLNATEKKTVRMSPTMPPQRFRKSVTWISSVHFNKKNNNTNTITISNRLNYTTAVQWSDTTRQRSERAPGLQKSGASDVQRFPTFYAYIYQKEVKVTTSHLRVWCSAPCLIGLEPAVSLCPVLLLGLYRCTFMAQNVSFPSQCSTVVRNTVVRAVQKWIGKPRFWTPVAP